MWDNLTPADVERATHQLNIRRAAVLKRHAEEIKNLDDEQNEIETFARVAAAFAKKFKDTAEPADLNGAQTEEGTTECQPESGSADQASQLKVEYQTPIGGPNFGGLIRRLGS